MCQERRPTSIEVAEMADEKKLVASPKLTSRSNITIVLCKQFCHFRLAC